ncbi:hypothetical protein ACFLSU_08860, partial [Bacteroidota bacterium]
MKKTTYLWIFILGILLSFTSCDKETFMPNTSITDYSAPKGLAYAEVTNVREYSAVKTGIPVLDTNGLIPSFEIISGRKSDGTILDDTYMIDVSITNPQPSITLVLKNGDRIKTEGDLNILLNNEGKLEFSQNNELTINEDVKLILKEDGVIILQILNPASKLIDYDGQQVYVTYSYDTKNNGVINISDDNKFGIGNYYFTIRATTLIDNIEYSTTFEDVFHLGVGPQLVTSLLYSPLAQNLIVNTDAKTSKPYLITGNPAVTFALTSDDDKLDIDSETGIISLKNAYTTTENDTIYPSVEVTSTISGESSVFK